MTVIKVENNFTNGEISVKDMPRNTWGQVTEWAGGKEYVGKLVYRDTMDGLNFFYNDKGNCIYYNMNEEQHKDHSWSVQKVKLIDSFKASDIVFKK